MARDLQRKFEQDADRKGLTGEARERYIGGAWNRVWGVEHRSSWRHSREAELLGRYYGPVHDFRERRGGRNVVFRQGARWYDMPAEEYWTLLGAAEQSERQEQRERKRIEARDARERREIARVQQAEEADRRDQERAARKRERVEAAARDRSDRELRAFERAQYRDVVAIIRRQGGIRPFKTAAGAAAGRGRYFRGEYAALPSTVRSSRGRLDMDQAAMAVAEELPHLKIETPDDLAGFFERHATYRNRPRRAA